MEYIFLIVCERNTKAFGAALLFAVEFKNCSVDYKLAK